MGQLFAFIAGLAGLANFVCAHPGHDIGAEAAEHAARLERMPIHGRNLNHCAERLRARGLESKSIMRRDQLVREIRERRGLDKGRSTSRLAFIVKAILTISRCRLSQSPSPHPSPF